MHNGENFRARADIRKLRVWLVHRGVWSMQVRSMPLALGYLKAAAEADATVRSETDIRIFAFKGGDSPVEMIRTMLAQGMPDIIGFSVYGWNVREFGILTETFRALNPDVWIVWGGPHVTGERVLRMHPGVDVVVNGEGEETFRELVLMYLAARRDDLSEVRGVCWRNPDGNVVITAPRGRIMDLNATPSPFLEKAMPLTDGSGSQLYDVAIMETNRGCPYKCAFCYWGGATGQKVRAFSRDRLRAELEMIARAKIATVCLCDANFGMLRQDAEFLEDVIEVREKYGFPRSIETSWAKNKGRLFYSIVRRMKEAGLRSSFTLALQSLAPNALDAMQRRNMKLNDFEDLAKWLSDEGMESYAELIWGMPGETCESFRAGYDHVAGFVSRIATYPHLILPNTAFDADRKKYGLVTVRGTEDDFEYVFSHSTMSFEDNLQIQRFLFWSRLMAEHGVLRFIWRPLQVLARFKQSETLQALDRWIDQRAVQDEIAAKLIAYRDDFATSLQGAQLEPALHYVHLEPGVSAMLEGWWSENVLARIPAEYWEFFADLFRYDCWLRPIHEGAQEAAKLDRLVLHGSEYFVRRNVEFSYDFPRLLAELVRGSRVDGLELCRKSKLSYDALYYKVGYSDYLLNQEFVGHFAGKTREQVSCEVPFLGRLAAVQDMPALATAR